MTTIQISHTSSSTSTWQPGAGAGAGTRTEEETSRTKLEALRREVESMVANPTIFEKRIQKTALIHSSSHISSMSSRWGYSSYSHPTTSTTLPVPCDELPPMLSPRLHILSPRQRELLRLHLRQHLPAAHNPDTLMIAVIYPPYDPKVLTGENEPYPPDLEKQQDTLVDIVVSNLGI